MNKNFVRLVAVFCCMQLSASAQLHENWPHWRGPTADGIANPTAKPPLRWNNKTNIQWIADLPGEGSATPIVWGDQVFVVSAEKTSQKSPTPIIQDERAKTTPDAFVYRFIVSSIDRNTGKIRWAKTAIEQTPHEGKHETNTYAAGSPTTDGERLFASFGSRGFYCYSLDGELQWQVDLGDMRTRLGWGEAVTPVLSGDLLIINWDQEERSFITALDKRTGKQVWKVDRPDEVTSWNTPLATDFQGKPMLVVNGTNRVRAVCMSGYRASCANAIPLSSVGDITDKSLVKWNVNKGTPYVPSPVISGKRLFFTQGNSDVLSCVDASTGEVLFDRRRISSVGSLYASPVVSNGHIYFVGREGTTVVLRDNEALDVVSVNSLQDAIDASPVAIGKQLFLRSWTKLYCIQE
jgi:outer membrane protein assembly factor BamB